LIFQKEIILPKFNRGFHIITDYINDAISSFNTNEGILNIFLKHTSASILINENTDYTVRNDMEFFFNKIVPENQPYYTHTFEGPDDMPAHIKSSILGTNLSIPISKNKLNLGTWQGVYLCEHRNKPNNRKLVLTLIS
tara:strand:+ start:4734 stop:5147 length:414 start_codon:yes stop_codon:yes gene_type:complete